jgi:hypothetical protein
MANKSEASLTFLDACDRISMYEDLEEDAIKGLWPMIAIDLAIVMSIKSADVEPYLVDSVIDVKKTIAKEFGVPIHANLGGSAWPEIQHV